MKIRDHRERLLKRLRNHEYAVGYLSNVIENESQDAFLIALRDVIDAREENISHLAEEANITRQTLYHALSENGNPRFSTINQVLQSIGLKLSVTKVSEAH